ncbi:M91 family zinc metallopeptidase [Gloeobacter kilaueensis]|uniref:RTX toxins-related Ca2+-binding protein n=1 Tax=Gloeobacter kilaueensis (strain ATCC BAA-2537 / CCAP 1431/1 / ULC 316 / JS1) TaxID=1183438 RepID=U5QFP6_GLOK1|nr:M91 family zinc metallopeptidase [Gloeobacter kilaueensis]AGY56500.1 RTX toxins-related Ca2+-binding protein [Gloeobacter kilaueensis JS1]
MGEEQEYFSDDYAPGEEEESYDGDGEQVADASGDEEPLEASESEYALADQQGTEEYDSGSEGEFFDSPLTFLPDGEQDSDNPDDSYGLLTTFDSDQDDNGSSLLNTFDPQTDEGFGSAEHPEDQPFNLSPAEEENGSERAPGFSETRDADGNITITGTDGDDNLRVSQHTSTIDLGSINLFGSEIDLGQISMVDGVTVTDGEGRSRDYLGDAANRLSIHGGDGDDNLQVDANVRNNIGLFGDGGNDVLTGGAGDDVIKGGDGNDTIAGGAGRDYIEGNAGDDNIYGNEGNDIIYGGRGNDNLNGNEGDDYLEGGKGDDFVTGNEGNDTVSGGRGNDELWGAEGNDVIYTGEGNDRAFGSAGDDRIYAGADDEVDGGAGTNDIQRIEFGGDLGTRLNFDRNVDVDGDAVTDRPLTDEEYDEFRDRVEDDIDQHRSSPMGQQMLRDYDASGHDVTFRRIDNDNGYADWANRLNPSAPQPILGPNGELGTGQDVTIGYNPSFAPILSGKEETPNEVLHHEMSHGWDMLRGMLQRGTYTGSDEAQPVPNSERQAVGLPHTGPAFDNDLNPSTPPQNGNPDYATERGYSQELGRSLRPSYSGSFEANGPGPSR